MSYFMLHEYRVLTVMQPTVDMYARSAMRSMILARCRISSMKIAAMVQMHDSSWRQLLNRCMKWRREELSRGLYMK